MRFHVTFRLFNEVIDRKAILGIREGMKSQIQHIASEGKLVDGAVFADWRGGYLIVDASSGYELMNLLGEAMIEYFELDSHPMVSFEDLGEFFAKHGDA